MGFATALSGLSAAANNLQVVGNNIANANTTGFKESRAEFADVYNSAGKTTPGAGVRVTEVAQQFNQGNIESTQNNLDLGISGNGFFAMAETLDSTSPTVYTRNGAFNLDPDGYIINDSGYYLMGGAPLGTIVDDGFDLGKPTPLKIDTGQGAPKATSQIGFVVNLDSREDSFDTDGAGTYDFATANVDAGGNIISPPDPDTYSSSTSTTVFDSLGNSHTMTTYFCNVSFGDATTGITNRWDAYVYLDGKPLDGTTDPATLLDETTVAAGPPITYFFDALGNIDPTATGSDTTTDNDDFVFANIDLAPLVVGAEPLSLTVNPSGTTQYAIDFNVNDLEQNGFAAGNLTGINFDKSGVLFAKYSNGVSAPLGQVILGRFTNNQGLAKLGDTSWAESQESGNVILGVAGGNNFGDISPSSLENSNVDIATQLVKLIVAQQAYQANAQTISTEDEIIQRILQL
jgi:flagellar hook protein FlgE